MDFTRISGRVLYLGLTSSPTSACIPQRRKELLACRQLPFQRMEDHQNQDLHQAIQYRRRRRGGLFEQLRGNHAYLATKGRLLDLPSADYLAVLQPSEKGMLLATINLDA
jgi:hypothetical protein